MRRNLFSAHLSRRPASSQSTASQPNSQSQVPSQRPPLPPSQNRNISPFASPPRLTPTHLPPSFNDAYDPTVSPHRSLSPRTAATLFPASSIIALNPTTGRPILPTLPALPARLRLSDSDDEPEEEGDDEHDDDLAANDDSHYHQHEIHGSTAHHSADASYLHPADPYAPSGQQHSQAAGVPNQQRSTTYATEGAVLTSGSPSASAQHDALVADLMARYRARQQHHHPRRQRRTAAAAAAVGRTRARRMQRAGAEMLEREHDDEEEDDEQDEEAEEERAELMAHLMGRLRREVARADEEGWMFGEPDPEGMAEGGMGTGIGGGLVSGGGASGGGMGVGVGVNVGGG
ncbi:MAG: hypothetical protein INR71_07885 [Terriglobus roseus]|nr:hypothetical protein [Terriglobus roseus]